MKRSVRLRLHDILEAIEGIEATVGEAVLAEYTRNWTIRRAVERGIESFRRPADTCRRS